MAICANTPTGVTAAEHAAPIDEHRLGITGWSYGGYMTMWTVTQTQRFRAAVAGAGLSNWQSYYGENGIDAGLCRISALRCTTTRRCMRNPPR